MDNFDLRKYLSEGRLLKEDKWVVYDTKTKKRLPNAGKNIQRQKSSPSICR